MLTSSILRAQCDDGWFTGKASLGYGFGQEGKMSFDYLYNLENHLSLGTGLGLTASNKPKLTIAADIRIRPLGHKRVMPAVWLCGGYASSINKEKGGSAYACPRIGIEMGNLAPVRFTLDIGAEFYDKSSNLMLNAGILF